MSAEYFLIGGAGAMGRITLRDLFETAAPDSKIWVLERDLKAAQAVVSEIERVSRRKGKRPALLAQAFDLLEETQKKTSRPPQSKVATRTPSVSRVMIQSAPYALNLLAMKLALAWRAHYVDLGGLFHMTRKQLKLHRAFARAGCTAILGMGAAPGITNLLAAWGAQQFDRLESIQIRVAGVDRSRYRDLPALSVSYSLKTILQEFSLKPAVFTRGKFRFVEPMSGAHEEHFPAPIGVRRPMWTLHSEVATLPLSFKKKGVREVDFKIAFDETFVDRVRFLRDLGFASDAPIAVGGVSVRPIDVVDWVAMHQKPAKRTGPLKQVEVVRAILRGKCAGKKVTRVLDCRTEGMPAWGIGIDIDTGSPPSVAAQFLMRNRYPAGVFAPEVILDPVEFFDDLARRKMIVTQKEI